MSFHLHSSFVRRTIALAIVLFSLAATNSFSSVARAGVSAQSASDPDVFYAFEGNLNDAANGSTIIIPPTCPANASNVCNVSTSFGSDAKGGYWAWTADRNRGGGFSIETNASMGTTFSIAIRLSITQTDCYRTIIDFTNGRSDDHLYFCGGMQMYPLATSTYTFSPNVVYDLLLNRTSTGRFVAYVLDNAGTPVQIIDQADNSIMIPFATSSGGSRLNFFHDECCEYATGGKVYDVRIWENRIVSPGDFTAVPQASAPSNSVLPVISGNLVAQQTLTASTGTWSGSPTPTFGYKWKRSSSSGGSYTDIPAATSSTYVVSDSDAGQFIKVEVTATNSQGVVSVLSAATSVIAAAPTTTSSTLPRTTTVPPTLNIEIQAPSTPTTVVGQASIATIAPSLKSVVAARPSSVGSVTTLPSATTTSVATLSTTRVTAPVPAAVTTGQAAVKVQGAASESLISRENNQIVVTAGSVKATFAGLDSKGLVSGLDGNGGISLKPGSRVHIKASGFKAQSKVYAWMFSTPVLMGSAIANSSGQIDATFTVPSGITPGNHRISIAAELIDGKPVEFTLGVGVVGNGKGTHVATWLIAIPLVLAILVAVFLPPAFRRRRKDTQDVIA